VTESWHEERNRLARLLRAIEAGTVTHIDQQGLRQLQPTNALNVSKLRQRLEVLDGRLGSTRA
jgi:hypothetical protein